MGKVRLMARVFRAFFNGIGIGSLAGVSTYGLMHAANGLVGTIEGSTWAFGSAPFWGAIVFFAFLTGSLGIELSKDIEATEKEPETK